MIVSSSTSPSVCCPPNSPIVRQRLLFSTLSILLLTVDAFPPAYSYIWIENIVFFNGSALRTLFPWSKITLGYCPHPAQSTIIVLLIPAFLIFFIALTYPFSHDEPSSHVPYHSLAILTITYASFSCKSFFISSQ